MKISESLKEALIKKRELYENSYFIFVRDIVLVPHNMFTEFMLSVLSEDGLKKYNSNEMEFLEYGGFTLISAEVNKLIFCKEGACR